MALTATRAEVRIRNHRHIQQAEAIGRTVRLMTRALPPSVETLVVTSVEGGIPVSSLSFRRSDVERLENTEAGRIAAVATRSDPAARNDLLVQSPGIAPASSGRWGRPSPSACSTPTSRCATRSAPP